MLVDDVAKVAEYDSDVDGDVIVDEVDDLEKDVVDMGEWIEDANDNMVVGDVSEIDNVDDDDDDDDDVVRRGLVEMML